MRDKKGRFIKGMVPWNYVGTTRPCLICGKKFLIKGKKRKKSGKYCSRKCYGKSRRGKPAYNKGKPQLKTAGEKNPNWKGGLPKCKRCGKQLSHYKPATFICMECKHKNSTYKSGVKYKKWAREIKERDNFTCQMCGLRGVYLESHHIKDWANYPELRFNLENGITLCRECHKKTDNYAGKTSQAETTELPTLNGLHIQT